MKHSVKFLLIFLVVSFLNACQKDDGTILPSDSTAPNSNVELKSNMLNTFYGPTVPMGNGVVRAWVSVNPNGDPAAVGVNLSEKAITNLPMDPTKFVLLFPKVKGGNFYTHALVDWNPQGHFPPGTYDLPHFDFHFYIISNEDRMKIGATDPELDVAPDSKYAPQLYLKIPGGEPEMGAHWIDLLSPEFNGAVFTKTFIWGSYNGEFIFWEPMITLSYLQSNPDDLIPLRQPSAFQREGWYAMDYKIAYSPKFKEYTVALMNLTHHPGE